MRNVLDHNIQQQTLALRRLGWTVRRIAQVTDVRRDTAARYLRAAGLSARAGPVERSASKSGHYADGVRRLLGKTDNCFASGVHRPRDGRGDRTGTPTGIDLRLWRENENCPNCLELLIQEQRGRAKQG
jgi:hypothetical protein